MIIHLKNKNTLIVDDFKFKCCVGKNGLKKRKIEGDKATPEGIFIIKHRSFFSYLGAHRYSAVEIPWGHLLLNDKQYEKFVNLHHTDRSHEMINFMQQGLSNPRRSVNDMIKIAIETGFEIVSVRYESLNHQHDKFQS